jgi:hypothetical protein
LFTRGDDNFDLIPLNFSFSYFGQKFSNAYISTNGFILFNVIGSCCPNDVRPNISNSIPALNLDLDTTNKGGIYYHTLNSQSSDYSSIKSDLNRLSTTFTPTNIFRVTYLNVHLYWNASILVSFQILLASDASSSFVLLKYTNCALPNVNLLANPGLNYINAQQSLVEVLLTSLNPCSGSNVNVTGTYVFDVTSINCKSKT